MKLIGFGEEPISDEKVNQHCNADPGLRENMQRHGLIYHLMGMWRLTAKGRHVMRQRARARQDALAMGQVQAAPEVPERHPFEDFDGKMPL